jgi:hypothetical protein
VEIRRITAQPGTLEDFYEEMLALGKENPFSEVASRMLEFFRVLRDQPGPGVWALTSHARLCLLAGDDYTLPCLAMLSSVGDVFHVECRVPNGEGPWPDAYVRGVAGDVTQAVEMARYGLRGLVTDPEAAPGEEAHRWRT